jgi:hypothetical protein
MGAAWMIAGEDALDKFLAYRPSIGREILGNSGSTLLKRSAVLARPDKRIKR